MKFLSVVEMGEELPSQRDSSCFYPKGSNEIINLRGGRDSKDIKQEKEREDGDEQYPIAKEEDYQAQKKGKSYIKP